ncbi:MAG TPA: hypothetical protein VD758_05020 [Gemmatimonadaceae bacterium]|nr:hypothetical protein [Gemmatimonadaceae bacterium]
MKKTMKEILAEYGMIAVVVYLVLFAAVLIGSYFAIRFGWTTRSAAGTAGIWTAAYIVTKITQPLRIAATVLLSAFIGRLWDKKHKPEAGV